VKKDTVYLQNGTGVYHFLPLESGSYRISLEAQDKKGNLAKARRWFWVWSPGYSWSWRPEKIEIKTDRDEYKIGQVARVLIISPVAGTTALLTLEGKEFKKIEAISLKDTITSIEIPILPDYTPNFYLTVGLIEKGRLYGKQKNIKVFPEQNVIKVKIASNQEIYEPGETATFSITTLNYQNQPVATEFSLAMVDEAIFGIMPDSTSDIFAFFNRENHLRTRTFSPSPGRYEYEYENGDWQLWGAFYEERNAETADGHWKGGDGGGKIPRVRKYFPDTNIWYPHLRTGADGRYELKVSLPDTLTTWRTSVKAIGERFLSAGQGVDKITTKKPVIARLETSRTFTQGDTITVSGVIHNYTPEPLLLQTTLSVIGVKLLTPETTSITVLPEEARRVDWQIKVEDCQHQEALLRLSAISKVDSDAMELRIPIIPGGIKERMLVGAGEVIARVDEEIIPPPGAIPGSLTATLLLEPSLAGTAINGLEYLIDYPYGCIEQTMSRFLPCVVVAKALKELNLPVEDKKFKELPKMIAKGLKKIYNYQNPDGSWGWFRGDKKNIWMTAYVTYGLIIAKGAGYEIDQNVLNRALSCLKNAQAEDLNIQSFARYVLTCCQWVDLNSLYQQREKLDDYGAALLSLSLANLGDARKRNCLAELKDRAKRVGNLVFWDVVKHYRYTKIEATSFGLKALLALEPDSELIPRVVRFLMQKRKGDRWHSTRDTAFALISLVDYLKYSEELNPDYQVLVYEGGRLIKRFQVNRENMFEIDGKIQLGVEEETTVTIIKELTGLPVGQKISPLSDNLRKGKLYYSLYLDYYTLCPKPVNNGIEVIRTYSTKNTAVGKEIEVTVTLNPTEQLEYVHLIAPFPAGCEVIKEPGERKYWWWGRYYGRKEVRDEKIDYFFPYLYRPVEVKYRLRAEIPGDCVSLPAQAYCMYYPEINGHSGTVEIKLVKRSPIEGGKEEQWKDALCQNFPNPFNPECWIPYQLSLKNNNQPVKVKIYNILGQLVREIRVGVKKAGKYGSQATAIYWDGRDNQGREVPSGVYFYQLEAGEFKEIKKMILLK
jgi:hypothetical protein